MNVHVYFVTFLWFSKVIFPRENCFQTAGQNVWRTDGYSAFLSILTTSYYMEIDKHLNY